MKRKITATTLDKLTPGKEFSDAESGMRVKVRESGKVTFSLRYRRPATGKGNKLTLGHFDPQNVEDDEPVLGGPLTLAQARLLCAQAKRDIAKGIDPALGKRDRRADIRRQGKDTFATVARDYIERYAKKNTRRWRATAQGVGFTVGQDGKLADELRPGSLAHRWRDTPLATLTKAEVRRVLNEKVDAGTPYGALGNFKTIRRVLNWAVDEDVLTHSPIAKMKPPHRAVSRERTLTWDEIRLLWSACESLGYPWGPLVRLLLVLGQRRDEVRKLSVDELSAVDQLITLPSARTKNKREHLVPLPGLAVELLEACPKLGNRYVFTTDGRSPVASISKATNKLRKLMNEELRKRTGDPQAAVPNFRLHDLRRTCATLMASLKVAPHVIDAVQNHVSGAIKGVSRTYNRYQYLDEKREALELWAETLRRQTTANVTEGALEGV